MCVTLKGLDYALLPVGKAASTSIREALLCSHGHASPRRYPGRSRALLHVYDAPFVAAFVRHPLDRLVSCWAHRIRGRDLTNEMRRLGYTADMTFAQFVRRVAAVGPDAETHTALQVTTLFDGERLIANFIGRFERLDEDWARVRRMLDLGPLPERKYKETDRKAWQKYYDDEIGELACTIYQRDLDFLGYT